MSCAPTEPFKRLLQVCQPFSTRQKKYQAHKKQLTELLEAQDCVRVKTAADGNCFWYALALELLLQEKLPDEYSTELTKVHGVPTLVRAAKQIQCDVFTWMSANTQKYEMFVPEGAKQGKGSEDSANDRMQEYINEHKKWGIWAGHFERDAAAHKFGILFQLHTVSHGGVSDDLTLPAGSQECTISMALCGGHYEPVIPKPLHDKWVQLQAQQRMLSRKRPRP